MGWVMASVRHLRGHQFGNVVLSHFPIRQHVQYDLSWRTCEPRCCQRADIVIDDSTLHLFNVHLGTAYRERRDQAERLATIVHDARIASAEDPARVISTSGAAASRPPRSPKKLQAIDLSVHLRRKRTYPGLLPAPAPRSHLLRGPRRDRRRGSSAHAKVADGLGPSAVPRRTEGRVRVGEQCS